MQANMETKTSANLRQVENDPRLLFWFAITLMLAMFFWSFFLKAELLRPGMFMLYAGLFSVHVYLHWKVEWIEKHRRWLVGYTLIQGLLAFGITYLSANVGMVFCLFMCLIGELLAMYRITFWGILASVYLLLLAFTNFLLLVGIRQAGWFALGTIPTIIFVALYVILFTRQAEANSRARELLRDLEAANHQLTEYAARVEDLTIANERQRMARELHDTLSQGLAGLILQLEAVDAHLAGDRTERGRAILQQSMEKARATLAEARQAIDNLRQPVGHDLADAVRREVVHFSASTGIPCEPQIDLPFDIPEAVTDAAGKVVAEGLTNIARHAQAKNIKLRLSGSAGKLEIEICDDGVGFDPEGVQAGHYGLLGMGERVRLAGGSLEVKSAPGQGTCILIRFPLEKKSDG
jgi:two-component system, NarL family, sensor histidine kinase YdfH